MKNLQFKVNKDTCRQWLPLLITYAINIALVLFFIMLLSDIFSLLNDLNESDFDSAVLMLVVLIVICSATIIFFQWFISVLFKALYDSRHQFNLNIRMMGVGVSNLMKMYLREFLILQCVAIPSGIIISAISYHLVSITWSDLGLSETINPESGLLGILIHVCVLCITIFLTFWKNSKISVIEILRGSRKTSTRFGFGKSGYVKSAIGIVLFAGGVSHLFSQDPQIGLLSILLILLSWFFLFDLLFLIYSTIMSSIVHDKGIFKISRILTAENHKKTKTLSLMIVISFMLIVGVQSYSETIRNIAGDMAEENIHYLSMEFLETPVLVSEIDNVEDANRCHTLKVSSVYKESRVWIQGVSQKFIDEYETIIMYDALNGINYDEFAKEVENPEWNGIILDEYLISEEDIGKTCVLEIGDTKVEFIIKGSYFLNALSDRKAYVSNEYLANALNLSGTANMIFYKDELQRFPHNDGTIIEKTQLVEQSYEDAIKGTEIIIVIIIIVLCCTIAMFLSYTYFMAVSSRTDTARFLGMGIGKMKVVRIYIYHILSVVAGSLIVAIPFAILLSVVVVNFTMKSFSVQGGVIYYPHAVSSVLIALFTTLPVFVYLLTNGRIIRKDFVRVLRDNIVSE